MSTQVTCAASHSATSSPVLAAGRSHFVVPAGQMIDLFGPVPVLANLSARQALELGLRTQDTFGLRSPGSSSSENLQSLLENRLRARLSSLGSTLYTLTWKPWVTPSGLSRFRLRASARRTSETVCTGWVTPTTRDHKDTPGMVAQRDGADRNDQLPRQAYLCGWPTPTASLASKGVRSTEGGIREAMRNHGPDLAAVVCLSGRPTPMADCNRGASAAEALRSHRPSGHKVQKRLQDIAAITGPARLTVDGQILTGSSAEMESGGQLSPEHPRWLMGYPVEWDACAPTETPSMLKRLRNS